ncbi:hypothetical protein PRIPAC_95385 [Pristionchus pacificus]|uniref:Uncharacterized protein n=1 Tax=Pristionchus pacificus TaxID=54126 RepID=A0A2A6D0M1_PRIPA|nr:hypothetical protein PRIPAC_95385 [Pristionchus pacificus]|eukprot:PDM83955.1 hypothetical protein PRIPAC_34147 [Pristionchus pacificus]
MRKRRWEILGILLHCITSVLSNLAPILLPVSCCLSNPHLPCSVASSQPSCRHAHGAVTSFQHDIYATGQYQGFLGDRVQARAYSELRSENEFALTDEELQCTNVTTCTWHNDAGDQLDWVTGFGEVAPTKLNIITGSTILPGSNFFILASDTRPSAFAGSLISKAIACQPSSGLLSFRYWRSRARVIGQEPDLDVCTRRVPDSTLENCLTIETTPNHTILATIPPIFEPFEIVIRGYGFENEPEGGLIILDSIDYFAQLDTAENCAVREQNTIPPEAIVDPATFPPVRSFSYYIYSTNDSTKNETIHIRDWIVHANILVETRNREAAKHI